MAKLPATEEGCRSLSQLPDDVKTKMNQNLAHKEREQRRRAIHGIAVTQFSERVPGTFKTTMNERCPEFLSETNRRKEAKATHLFGGINYIDCLEERTAFLENELRKRGIDVENLRSKETDRRIIEDNAVKLSASIKRKAEEFNVPWPPTSGSRGESRKRRKSL